MSRSIRKFFGCVRSVGARNINPTCINFCGAYKVLLINNLSSRHTFGRNCEEICDGHLLFFLKNYIVEESENDSNINEEVFCTNIMENIPNDKYIRKRVLQNNRPYSALLKNIVVKAPFKQSTVRKTTITESIEFQQEVQNADKIIKKVINKVYYKYKIKNTIERAVQEKLIWTSIICNQHKEQLKTTILSGIINICLQNFCITVNRCLNGKLIKKTHNHVLTSA